MKLFVSLFLLVSMSAYASQPNNNNNLKVPQMPPLWLLAASAVPGVNLIVRGTPLASTIVSAGVAMVTSAVRNHPKAVAVTTAAAASAAYQTTQTPPNTARGTDEKNQ